jgi:PKD repeat protein
VDANQRINGSQWNDLGTYYFSAGSGSVVLTNDASGNPVADAIRIIEITSPVANFEATPLEGESPLSVSFQNLSVGNTNTFLWDFGDGGTSTEENPIHEYLLSGIYTVTLEVAGTDGSDTETKTDYITVREPGAFEQIIDNDSTDFIMDGSWYSSTLVPGYYGSNYRWASGGYGDVSAEWTFQIPSDGYYQVLAWWSSPYETRSPDAPYTIYHSGGSTTVDADQRINGSQWNDLGTYYFSAGVGSVVLTDDASGNPVADAVQIIYVGDSSNLVASFTASPMRGISPLDVNFTDQSFGEIEEWFWDFGDGETSTEKNPLHIYQNPGTYSVILTVKNAGQESTRSETDYITVFSGNEVADEFIWPIDEQDFFIFQKFGNERLEVSGYHSGDDFGTYQLDTEVHCIANGWVEKFNSGFGYSIMIRHLLPDGELVYSWYNHLAYSVDWKFTIGQFIPIGTVIGIAGEAGWTPSGVHTHLEIKKYNDSAGGYITDLSDHLNPSEFILSRLTYNPSPPDQCSDNTPVNECSAERPLNCIEGGFLVENSLFCGCDSGVPQADGTCSKTEDSSGNWERSTLVMGFYASDYLIAYAGGGNSIASWVPDIQTTGNYDVYGWWRDRFSAEPSERATTATITINHAGKQDQVTVDFSEYYFKEWKYLGTFLFEEGSNNSVVLLSTQDGDVIADAFRFVWASPPDLSAGFIGSPTDGIVPLNVSFTDLSTGTITGWSWDFGDGATSSEQNSTHEYTAEGIYTVSLTVSGPGGSDSVTNVDYIIVNDLGTFEQIIDNDSTDFIMNGSWYSSTLVPGYYGSNYRWHGGLLRMRQGLQMHLIPSIMIVEVRQ